jgi:HK97 gp10 family phage protein
MGMTFDASELIANMELLRNHVVSRGARRAVVAGAKVIGAAMIERTPQQVEKKAGSNSLEPGEVKRGIKVRSRTEDGEPVALVGPTGKGGSIGRVAHAVEYGHRIVTGGKSKLGVDGNYYGGGKVQEKDVPAYPFLRPAYEASSTAAIEAVGAQLGNELKVGTGNE